MIEERVRSGFHHILVLLIIVFLFGMNEGENKFRLLNKQFVMQGILGARIYIGHLQ
jgi:hypothetical protein